MASLAERFEAQVDRSGEHHRWLGAINADRGTGRLKVDGRHVTAHRVAWELANGPLPAGTRVLACEEEPACVRIEHLRVEGASAPAPPKPRARKGTGSVRRLQPGVWKLTVTGVHADGTTHRLYRTVYADNEEAARAELAQFVTETRGNDGTTRADARRVTLDARSGASSTTTCSTSVAGSRRRSTTTGSSTGCGSPPPSGTDTSVT